MKLNELFEKDIDDVFFDSTETMEYVNVNGEKMPGILILESQLSSKISKDSQGIYQGDGTVLYLKYNEEFYYKNRAGKILEINEVMYKISNRSKEFGMAKFKLEDCEGY
ncbi:hypothetical protein SAMN02745174_02281 [Cetobacterium ceti]|uniref:ATP-binding sugar transporter n=1 Tax=Cetobacterium ceti TaxID=180163 RepID=A0A1T4QDD2_9FUSO|nr:hypothetical protein [Cetobacterium ceti]SKA01636.1 hypothetical protein SAMN02745174_02281 [Cetobacterium ceti]